MTVRSILLAGHDYVAWLARETEDRSAGYEDQLDPELLARVEAWRAEERCKELEAARVPDNEADEPGASTVSSIYLQGAWDTKRGRHTVPAELEPHAGGWHLRLRGRTGFPKGRPTTYRDGAPNEVLRALRHAVGISQVKFNRVVKRRKGRDPLVRREVAEAFARAVSDGHDLGVVRHLAAAYKCSESTVVRLAAEGRQSLALSARLSDKG